MNRITRTNILHKLASHPSYSSSRQISLYINEGRLLIETREGGGGLVIPGERLFGQIINVGGRREGRDNERGIEI